MSVSFASASNFLQKKMLLTTARTVNPFVFVSGRASKNNKHKTTLVVFFQASVLFSSYSLLVFH